MRALQRMHVGRALWVRRRVMTFGWARGVGNVLSGTVVRWEHSCRRRGPGRAAPQGKLLFAVCESEEKERDRRACAVCGVTRR